MDLNKIPKREILVLAIGEAAVCTAICLIYLLIGKFDYTVPLGAALGAAVTLLNFVLLCVSVNRALDKVLEKYDPSEQKPSAEGGVGEKICVSEGSAGAEGEGSSYEDDGEYGQTDDDDYDDSAARFARENAAKLANAVKLSYVIRTATIIAALVIALLTKKFNPLATVIPLLCLRPILTVAEIIRKKEDKK